MVAFEIGKHYDGCICLARKGVKDVRVYMPPHKIGEPTPEYCYRGKNGIDADWFCVRVENGVEVINSRWGHFRADRPDAPPTPSLAYLIGKRLSALTRLFCNRHRSARLHQPARRA